MGVLGMFKLVLILLAETAVTRSMTGLLLLRRTLEIRTMTNQMMNDYLDEKRTTVHETNEYALDFLLCVCVLLS
jgi:hypothetical protein